MEYTANRVIKDKALLKMLMPRILKHDMDKLIMYQFLEKEEASRIHQQTAEHHMTNNVKKDWYDKLEAVIDYESSGYTKPDKPLNAYDTIVRYKTECPQYGLICDELIGICRMLRINQSYKVTDIDQDYIEFFSQYENVTEEMILEDIKQYFKILPTLT